MVTRRDALSSESVDGQELIPEGERNTKLTSIAGSMRHRGMTSDEMLPTLLEVNRRRCMPPLSDEEVTKIAESVAKYQPGVLSLSPKRRRPKSTWPDPLADEAYHGVAGEIVGAIEPHSEADPVALLGQFLTAFGNLVGHGPHVRVEGDDHGARIFVALVGDTSKGRKGVSWSQVRRLLEYVDSAWVRNCNVGGLSSGEGLIYAVRDPRLGANKQGEIVLVDPGVEDKRLLVFEPELARVLQVAKRETNPLSAVIRQAWDTGHLHVLNKNDPLHATNAHISCIFHITRTELLRHLDTTEMANGFANRIQWLCVRRSKVLPEGGSLDDNQIAELGRKVKLAAEKARTVSKLHRDEKATKLWAEVYPTLSEGKPGLFGAIISRSEAQVTRLSCIYALLDGSPVIRKEHLQAALALETYAEASTRYVFGGSLGDPVADEILRALSSIPGGMTRTEIRDLFQRHRDANQIDRALTLLEEHGLAKYEMVPTGGRPTERWYEL